MPKTKGHQERWQLSGSGAASYQQFQVPSVFEPLARLFLERFPLSSGARLLDVACGTGIVARLAAPIVGAEGRIVAIDLNPDMIAVAEAEPAAEGAPIAWQVGDAAALPFEDASFDLVLCQQGLQFVPDKPAALAEMHRVLAPGGRLGLCQWRSAEHSPYMKAAAEALTPHLGAPSAARILAPFVLGDEDTLRALVEGAGFSGIAFQAADLIRRMLPPGEAIPGQLASTPVGPDFQALDEETRAEIVARITEAVSAFLVPGGMEIPQGAYVVSAVK